MTTATDKLIELRAVMERSTAHALRCARRNEFIGDPVTSFERQIRHHRDRQIARQLRTARAALERFEQLCHEAGA